MTDQGGLQAVDAFWAALHEAILPEDEADGWTEAARAASAEAMERVRVDLLSGWGEHADHASRHLLRALDHWGIGVYSRGRLAALGENAQMALIRRREERE